MKRVFLVSFFLLVAVFVLSVWDMANALFADRRTPVQVTERQLEVSRPDVLMKLKPTLSNVAPIYPDLPSVSPQVEQPPVSAYETQPERPDEEFEESLESVYIPPPRRTDEESDVIPMPPEIDGD